MNILSLNRGNVYSLLNESIEQQPTGLRGSTIEAEHEFIQIKVHMRRPGSALRGQINPFGHLI